MPALRIAFVAPFGVRQKGTTRARVIPLAAALAARGHTVRVVVPAWDSPVDWGRVERVGQAEIVHLPTRPVRSPEYSPAILAQTWCAVADWRPDVLHCFKPIGYSGAVALLVARTGHARRKATLVAVDADDLEGSSGWARRSGRPWWQAALLDLQERRTLCAAALVTVASQYLLRRAAAWGVEPRRLHYLPNAVNLPHGPTTSARPLRAGPPKLLLYTRFNEFSLRRGVDAIGRVLSCLDTALLTVVGDGPQRAAFERLVLGRPWASRVRFAGFLEGRDLAVALSGADVAIWLFDDTPINRARSPVKLVELLAAGVPVVAEAVGEVAALAGAGLRLVRPGNVRELTTAVVTLALGAAKQPVQAMRAQERASRTPTWEARAEALEQRYLSCT